MSVNIDYQSDFLSDFDVVRIERPWRVMNQLAGHLAWRNVAGNRLEYWTNTKHRAYTYGQGIGQRTYLPQVSHPQIDMVRERIRVRTGILFEGCFLNFYRHGGDSLSWHADDDTGIDHSKPIAVVSLGDARRIEWKERDAKGMEAINGQVLEHGSLFLMPAGMQSTHVHRIPKALSHTAPRMSLTFRALI